MIVFLAVVVGLLVIAFISTYCRYRDHRAVIKNTFYSSLRSKPLFEHVKLLLSDSFDPKLSGHDKCFFAFLLYLQLMKPNSTAPSGSLVAIRFTNSLTTGSSSAEGGKLLSQPAVATGSLIAQGLGSRLHCLNPLI